VVLNSERNRVWRAALVDALRLLELSRLVGSRARRGPAPGGHWAARRGGGRRRRPLGRPGADLESAAVAVRVIALIGLPSEGDAAGVDFLHSCEDGVLGLRSAPMTAMTSVGGLWGGLSIALALNVPLRYPQAVSRSIARLQRPNGGLGARDGAIPTLHDTWLGVHAACLLERLQAEPRL